MEKIDTIGLVGGGQMGEALINGILKADLVAAGNVLVAEPDQARQQYLSEKYGVRATSESAVLADVCSVIILAVKPQIMPLVVKQYNSLLSDKHLLISIAAGISLRVLEKGLGKDRRIVRVMPNTPSLILEGAAGLTGNGNTDKDDMAIALKIFSAVGSCYELPESMLDAVTGLSGSGPGYVFAFIEAMIDGGVLAGIPRPVAEKLVLQTVYGSVKLAMETGEHPAVLKGKVTSPGGTTIAGLHVLEESGFRGSVMSAIEVATERSRELGQ